MFGTSFATREWLKKYYPSFAELWHPNDPKPNPSPTSKKKFLLSLNHSLCALGGAFVLSLFFSNPTENDGLLSGPTMIDVDRFVLISCFMLYAVWDEIGTYFRKMVEIQREFKIFRDADLLSEWNKKWEDYLHPSPPGDDYDYTDIA